MAETTSACSLPTFLEELSRNSMLTFEDRSTAWLTYLTEAMPSRTEEDWRRTNPEEFPWHVLGDSPSDFELTLKCKGISRDGLLDSAAAHERLRALLEITANDSDAKLLLANLALAQPVVLSIPRNANGVEIELLQRWTGEGAAPLTLVLVESGAEVILHDRLETHARAVVGRVEIIVEQNAKLTYIQDESIASSAGIYRAARIHAHRDSRVNWTCFTTGAQWHAARLGVFMHEPGVEAHLYGLFSGEEDARADHRTKQHHGAPSAMSNLLFKNLLAGRSHSVYQGVITVPQNAQKTDAYQTCRNLMLDQGTHADAMPKLEIIADDVKCSHGASIGSLNKEQLFYLQTRGLSRREAMTAIASGFAEEIIQTVPLEHVREQWRRRVSATISRAEGE